MAKNRQRQIDEFGIAESLGDIVTMPEINEEIVNPDAEKSEVIDNPQDFRMAIGRAAMEGEEYIEVSEKLFKYLLKNSKSPYLTYGDPGIKVYLAGTREEIEREERMSAEQYAEYIGKKQREAANV